jgi:RNA polymerase sigma factor (sigma-70 family)
VKERDLSSAFIHRRCLFPRKEIQMFKPRNRDDAQQDYELRQLARPSANIRNPEGYRTVSIRRRQITLDRRDCCRRRVEATYAAQRECEQNAMNDPAIIYAVRDQNWHLYQCIQSLPASQCKVITGIYLCQKSIAQVAAALGCSQSAVNSSRARALKNLRSFFGQ